MMFEFNFRTMNDMIQNLSSVDLRIPTAVAVSGGVDSMSLLHVLASRAREVQQPLWAFHIHHDLQAAADDWLARVRETAVRLGVSFDTRRLDARTQVSAQSVEEWARQGRYRALADLAQQHGVRQIVLAHHEDDQIETYLLQTERGAGVRGQSAMPTRMERHGIAWLRPWLTVSRAQIHAYAHEHGIEYVHDPSNVDPRFKRSAIRVQLAQAPLTAQRRADILNAIQTAQRQQASDSAWAQQIIARHSVSHRVDIGECGRLRAVNLSDYSAEQAHILLREWMAQMGWRMPSRVALDELLRQLSKSAHNRQMCWRHADGWAVTQLKHDWIAARLLPTGQWFLTDEVRARITREGLNIRARAGGERLRLADNRPSIDLKHAYQMYGVAPMLRGQLPLLYDGEWLVHVVGVGDVLPADH